MNHQYIDVFESICIDEITLGKTIEWEKTEWQKFINVIGELVLRRRNNKNEKNEQEEVEEKPIVCWHINQGKSLFREKYTNLIKYCQEAKHNEDKKYCRFDYVKMSFPTFLY